MKLHRFIDSFDFSHNEFFIESFEIVHQLTYVLRVKKGEKIILCDGQGKEAKVEILEIQKTQLQVKILEKYKSIPEPQRQLTLYAAIIKGEHFEILAEKAVEIGVHKIVPIITSRTVKLNLKLDRIQKIMKEAAEQCGRGIVPTLEEPILFKDALKHCQKNEKNFFCDFTDTVFSSSLIVQAKNIGCFVGPEGGWDDTDRTLVREKKLIFLNLGKFTLRAETASMVATYILSSS